MFRSSLRHVRPSVGVASRSLVAGSRRTLATGSNAPKGTWRGSALRWGLAGVAVYVYNTSPIFQDVAMPQTVPSPPQFSENDSLTIDAVVSARRAQIKEEQAAKAAAKAKADAEAKEKAAAAATKTTEKPATEDSDAPSRDASAPEPGSPAALEAEAGQQGAFNPETGEINWDCPCLGGMADGPCGEEFKLAFSCFVYSEEEPKGMDCIEKFQGMQTCFRAHPDIYGAELDDDEPQAEFPDAPSPEGAVAAAASLAPEEAKKEEVKPEASSAAPQAKSETA
ncbi:uncharacterized protein BROUX77_000494 [Berkeleyomyces rouxiae]|uniref:uncharacterized protein n=1 Tax=Berkeleyomyces rouxiae TaxID=2035830 RepID=UPI003B7E4ACB